jgi:alpha-ribazole phosphatase
MNVVFARHLAPAVAPGACYGRLDVGVSEAGMREMPALVRALASQGAACVWSSPAIRCRVLAEAVAEQARIGLRLHPSLLEMDFGEWEGRAWDDVPRAALDLWASDPLGFSAPGGETGRALIDRVAAVWGEIRGAGKDCVVVTHGGPLRVLLALAQNRAPDLLSPAPAFGSVAALAC